MVDAHQRPAASSGGLEQLEQELHRALEAIRAYRASITFEAGSAAVPTSSTIRAPLVAGRGVDGPLRAGWSADSGIEVSLESMADASLGESGWTFLSDCWVLRAADGFRLRLNVCERALLLAFAKASDHALSLEELFAVIEGTRSAYGQRPLAKGSMRMVVMRLMKKLSGSKVPGPLLSVHGWGYRLSVMTDLAQFGKGVRSMTQPSEIASPTPPSNRRTFAGDFAAP